MMLRWRMASVNRRMFIGGTAMLGALGPVACRGGATFPQGVASGDPRPDRVVLWTRAAPDDGGEVVVRWEIATDPELRDVVADGEATAGPASDHTVKVVATGLSPRTTYHYRFRVGGSASPVGRTRTAPAPDDDVPVRIAVASCQDYVGRYYHAWRALLEEPDVDVVVFLGDYIYETVADPRHQRPTADRNVELPDGLPLTDEPGNLAARTLADYRALYRQIRADPDLQEVHRRFPFVAIWDDHEHTNDAWQDVANEFDEVPGEERDPDRRAAATQAWVEHLPVDVPFHPGRGFPDDVVTWRSLRFGRHAELLCTDCRYYRDDHLVPESEPAPEVGKITAPSAMGSRILARKEGFDPLEAAARPTMLGEAQLDWLIGGIRGSGATFKLWVSPVMVAQLALDLREEPDVHPLLQGVWYFKLDQWDGYRSERREILEAVADVPGVVVLSGDLHGAYAAELRPDFDAPETPATAVELTVTGISSIPLADQLASFVELDPLLASLDLGPVVGRFDEAVRASGPHFVHADGRPYGFAVVTVDGDELVAEMIDTSDATDPTYGGVVRRTRFSVPAAEAALRYG
jgi:alkaline phosphatase D